METNEFLNLGETLIHYATGENLDFIGEIFGVYRLGAQVASITQGDNNFQFYYAGIKKFGDINSGQAITIPAGTLIMTAGVSGPPFLTRHAVHPPTGRHGEVCQRLLRRAGQLGNAAAGVFNRYGGNIKYSNAAFGSLLVTNTYGVVGGRDDESDDNYRYRIQQKLQGRNGVNEAALRFELLQVPGIQDIVFERQAGTFNCYVYGIAPQTSSSLLDAVQQTINDNVAFPLTGSAIAPDLVGISLVTTLSMATSNSTTDQDTVIGEAVAAAQDYIDNLRVGEQLVINEIADRIRNADTRILDVGQPNKQIPEIYIWRARDDGTRYSRSKVKCSFISCFHRQSKSNTKLRSAGRSPGNTGCYTKWGLSWCATRSLRPLPNLFRRAPDANGVLFDGYPSEPPRCRGALLRQFRMHHSSGWRAIDSRPHTALQCTLLKSAWGSHAPRDAALECRIDADG